ncbi:hypothetical protein KUCAC02_021998 [Chaenocephalus aceratus]|nr:hypothetical protein KUCAC02_021998 [Chaenocephalus aceratus]
MRLGGMFITMAYLASIGKLYGDGGLFDILTESDVYAEGTARQLLQGKQLARGIRSIKLASEALFRLFWKAMQSWLEKKGKCAITGAQEQLLRDVQHAFHGNDKATAQQLIAYVDAMKDLCDTDAKGPKAHKEHGASRMDRDEGDIQKIMEAVEQKQNPFDLDSIPEELINIVVRLHLRKLQKSCQVSSKMVLSRMPSLLNNAWQNPKKNFWDPEKRKQCATFKDIGGVSTRKVPMDSDVHFRRLLAVSKQREVSMETVMSHELAAVPPLCFMMMEA